MGLGIVLFSRLENWFDAFALRIGAPMETSGTLLGGRDVVLLPRLSHASVLDMHLARSHGVSAGLDYLLPGRFLWQLTTDSFEGVQAQAPFEAERLRWSLLRILRRPDDMPPALAARVRALSGDARGGEPQSGTTKSGSSQASPGSELALFDLAERLARVFEGYVLNRPDWLQAWQRKASALPQGQALGLQQRERFAALEPWQAWLWQRILEDIGELSEEHPFARFERDLGQVVATARAQGIARITVMGLPGLTSQQMRLLALLGQHLDVRWLAMNPCRSFWDDLPELARQVPESFLPDEPWLNEQGPRLLGLWGKAQRDYLAQLRDLESVPGLSVGLAEIDVPADTTLPGRLRDLQQAIEARSAFPAVDPAVSSGQAGEVGKADTADEAPGPASPGLQVHGGQGLTHQLLLLREALLHRLEGPQADLKPSDCLILCTDLEAARPAIHQVFGTAGEGTGRMAYRIAPAARPSGALSVLLLDLLALRWSAFSLEQLAAWLAQPLFSRLVQLEATQAAQWHERLGAAGFITNRGERHGFDAALERLLLGAALPQPAGGHEAPALQIGELVVDRRALPLSSPQDLAQLDSLIGLLRSLERLTQEALTLAQWVEQIDTWLIDWVDPLLPAPDGEALREDVMALRLALNRLARLQATAATGAPEAVDVSIFRRCLEQALTASGGSLQLSGGINFMALGDGLLPPVRLVALLGMDLSRWPRPSLSDELDLTGAWPRRGDLSSSAADRAALLDALLAARSDFWLFYEAVDAVSGEILGPASPVSELLVSTGLKPQIHRVPVPAATRRPARLEGEQAHVWTLGYGLEQRALRVPMKGATTRVRRRIALQSLSDLAFDPARAILRHWSLDIERDESHPTQEPLDGSLREAGRAWRQSDLTLALVRDRLRQTALVPSDAERADRPDLADHPHLADGPVGQHMARHIAQDAAVLLTKLDELLTGYTGLAAIRLTLSIGDTDLDGQVLLTTGHHEHARQVMISTRSVSPRDKLLLVLHHALCNSVRGATDSHLVTPDKVHALSAIESPQVAAAYLEEGLQLLAQVSARPECLDTAPLVDQILKPSKGGPSDRTGDGEGEGADADADADADTDAQGGALSLHGQLLWKEPGLRGAVPPGLQSWLDQAATWWGGEE